MTDREPLLSPADVARLAEVGPAAVSNWRTRHSDFPAPRLVEGVDMFVEMELAEWLASRRIAKNRLKPDEGSGTTYGERFLRNSGSPVARARATDQPSTQHERDLAVILWAALDQVRGSLDVDFGFGLLEALLVLKLRHPEQWERVRSEARPDVLRSALDRVLAKTASDLSWRLATRQWESTAARALPRLIRVVDEVDLPGDDGDIARLLLGLLEQLASALGRRGDHHTPSSVTRVMVGLTAPTPLSRVYDPFCRSGELLLSAAVHARGSGASWEGLSLVGHAANERDAQQTSMSAALTGIDIDVDLSRPLETDVDPGSAFDVVLANPPFALSDWAAEIRSGDKRWRYGVPPRHNANFAWLQHAVAALATDGRAAALMANGATFTQNKAEAAIRTGLVEAGAIECVIALPDRLFASTGIPVSLWVLRAPCAQTDPEILFIDATQLGSMSDRRQRTLSDEDVEQIVRSYQDWRDRSSSAPYEPRPGLARNAGLDEIRERRFVLNPRSYVESAAPGPDAGSDGTPITELRLELNGLTSRARGLLELFDEELSQLDAARTHDGGCPPGWHQARLGDVCDVLAGPGSVATTMGGESPVRLVVPRTIRYSRLAGDTKFAAELDARARLSRYRLEAGDVVCVRTGGPGRNGLVGPEEEGWFLGPGCVRLRPLHSIDSAFLTYYLATPAAQDWVDRNSSGSAIRSISTRILSDLPLTLPPLPTQRAMGALLGALDETAMVHERLAAITVELRGRLLSSLMSDASEIGR
jgi:type I restriction enzyme M protein